MGLWNLLQLANALYPLIGETEPLEAILQSYHTEYPKKYITMMREKLGLQIVLETDLQLITNLEKNLQASETDMTIFFRNLSQVSKEESKNVDDAFFAFAKAAFYKPDEITGKLYLPTRN